MSVGPHCRAGRPEQPAELNANRLARLHDLRVRCRASRLEVDSGREALRACSLESGMRGEPSRDFREEAESAVYVEDLLAGLPAAERAVISLVWEGTAERLNPQIVLLCGLDLARLHPGQRSCGGVADV